MRKALNLTEGIFPMPVLMVATYNDDGSVNVMNAAWGTMQERGSVALNLTQTHKTVKNIRPAKPFLSALRMPPMSSKPIISVRYPVIGKARSLKTAV